MTVSDARIFVFRRMLLDTHVLYNDFNDTLYIVRDVRKEKRFTPGMCILFDYSYSEPRQVYIEDIVAKNDNKLFRVLFGKERGLTRK